MKEFEEIFTKLAKQHDANTVFNDFLDFSIDLFLLNPGLNYFDYKKYTGTETELFMDLFSQWCIITDEKINHEKYEWFDMLGVFYEDVIQSKWKAGTKGQFFTPTEVTDLVAKLINTHKNEDSAYDATCGSGRLLLSWHVNKPKDILFGADLDIVSCKMTVLNFIIHGVKGSVYNMDSLTGDYYNGWKVNEFLDNGELSVMEIDSIHDRDCFIGVKKYKTIKSVDLNGQVTLGAF